jgi:hypothetical protein
MPRKHLAGSTRETKISNRRKSFNTGQEGTAFKKPNRFDHRAPPYRHFKNRGLLSTTIKKIKTGRGVAIAVERRFTHHQASPVGVVIREGLTAGEGNNGVAPLFFRRDRNRGMDRRNASSDPKNETRATRARDPRRTEIGPLR